MKSDEFGVAARRPLPDTVTRPAVADYFCYSHRTIEELDDIISCRWSYAAIAYHRRITDMQYATKSDCYFGLRRRYLPLVHSQNDYQFYTPFLLFYPRNVHLYHSKKHLSKRFDDFCILFSQRRYSLCSFLYMPPINKPISAHFGRAISCQQSTRRFFICLQNSV